MFQPLRILLRYFYGVPLSLPGLKNAISWLGQSRVRPLHLWGSSERVLDHNSLSYLGHFPNSILTHVDSPPGLQISQLGSNPKSSQVTFCGYVFPASSADACSFLDSGMASGILLSHILYSSQTRPRGRSRAAEKEAPISYPTFLVSFRTDNCLPSEPRHLFPVCWIVLCQRNKSQSHLRGGNLN